jgi:hypothetical protein
MGPIGCPETSVINYQQFLSRYLCILGWIRNEDIVCTSVYCNFEITRQVWRRTVARSLHWHLSGEFRLGLNKTNVARADLCRLSKQDCTSHALWRSTRALRRLFHFQVSYIARYIRKSSLIYARKKKYGLPCAEFDEATLCSDPLYWILSELDKIGQNFIYCLK